jgi:hypothetical protein
MPEKVATPEEAATVVVPLRVEVEDVAQFELVNASSVTLSVDEVTTLL